MNISLVRAQLPGREIHYLPSVDTTMRVAAELAAAHRPSGTAVVAGEQTAGMGRHGHDWHSEGGLGLYTSVIVRPPLAPESLPLLTLAAGLAVAEAIARATDLACDLRWPNDVLLDEKKLAGVLVHLIDSAAIVGIGVNVNHAGFPPGFDTEPTSLHIALGREQSREILLVHLLRAVDGFCKMLEDGGRGAILDLFARRSSYAHGRRVVVRQGDSMIAGTTAGLTDSGFLRLQKDDGSTEVIVAGGVRAVGAGRG